MTDPGWTLATLAEYLNRRIEDERSLTAVEIQALRGLLQERYETQTKALDAAFVAAEKAMQTALASAERAVSKAESAAERRFESVNEFRQTLTDQAATFMPRVEAEQRIQALADKHDDLAARVDKTEGTSTGKSAGWQQLVSVVILAGALVAIVVAFLP